MNQLCFKKLIYCIIIGIIEYFMHRIIGVEKVIKNVIIEVLYFSEFSWFTKFLSNARDYCHSSVFPVTETQPPYTFPHLSPILATVR